VTVPNPPSGTTPAAFDTWATTVATDVNANSTVVAALPGTYEPIQLIAAQTLGSSASTVTFSSIPQTFRHLEFVVLMPQNAAAGFVMARLNGSLTLADYDFHRLRAQGTSVNATIVNANNIGCPVGEIGTGSRPSGFRGTVFDYTSTARQKFVMSQFQLDAATQQMGLMHSWWTVTPVAVTSIVFAPIGTSFPAGSQFALYGRK
jgi:hypothetical protein